MSFKMTSMFPNTLGELMDAVNLSEVGASALLRGDNSP